LKINTPKNIDKEFVFKVRVNFCPSYFQIKDEKDHQIFIDFLSAFPKVKLDRGFNINFPKALSEKIDKLPNVVKD